MQDTIRLNQAILLYRYGRGGVVMSIVASCFMTLLPEASTGTKWPFLWLSGMLLVLLARVTDLLLRLRRGIEAAHANHAIRCYAFGVLSSAAMWALFPVLFFHAMSPLDRNYMATILYGMAGGSATVLAPIRHIAWFYCGALLIPASVMFLLEGGQGNISLGILGVVFFCVMAISTRITHRATVETLRLSDNLDQTLHSLQTEMDDHRNTESRLRQAQKLEAVGQLTAGVAHDFNNLLMTISGNAELLLRHLHEQATQAARATSILDAAERGGRLTLQLLAFARNQPLQPQHADLNAIIRDMDRLIATGITDDIRLELDLSPKPQPVFVDPAQMTQVVLNLAANAKDAMPAGGTLTIRTANIRPDAAAALSLPADDGYVLLSIGDTGIGMSQDVLRQAYDPFFTTKPVGQGSGLGLSEVHGIVQQSGGITTIQSEPGRGTTVSIYLPRAGSPPIAASS